MKSMNSQFRRHEFTIACVYVHINIHEYWKIWVFNHFIQQPRSQKVRPSLPVIKENIQD